MSSDTNSPKLGLPVIIIAIVVLAAAGGGYYFLSQRGVVPAALPLSNQVNEQMFAEIKDPLVRKHFVAQYNQKAFRIMSQTSEKNGGKNIMEFQTSGDSVNYRMTTVDNSGKEESQLISIGNVNYAKDYKDGKWWKETPKPVKDTNSPRPTGEFGQWTTDLKKEFEKAQGNEYTQLGKEACGSLMCYKYQEIIPLDKENGKRIIWFDDSKYLERKEEADYGSIKTTAEYSYDNVSVSIPSPTKDVPEGHSIYEYLYGENPVPGGYTGVINNKDLENAQKELEKMQKGVPTEYPSDGSGE